jgi:Flp pilus assembly protein TadG
MICARTRATRRGIAAAELAVAASVLGFIFVICVDFARIYYYTITIESCARQGAIYASDPTVQSQSPYSSVSQAALAEASNLSPQPNVSSSSGTDKSNNPYIEVTVTWRFSTISSYAGLSSPYNLSRTVRMRVTQATPN